MRRETVRGLTPPPSGRARTHPARVREALAWVRARGTAGDDAGAGGRGRVEVCGISLFLWGRRLGGREGA